MDPDGRVQAGETRFCGGWRAWLDARSGWRAAIVLKQVNEAAIVNYIMNQLVQIPNRQDGFNRRWAEVCRVFNASWGFVRLLSQEVLTL